MTSKKEEGNSDQLNLPGLRDKPILAEHVFLRLSRKWAEEFAITPPDCPPPRDVDLMELASLLVAAEWGSQFTKVALEQIEQSLRVAGQDYLRFMDHLVWELALASFSVDPSQSDAVTHLVENLDHHNSSIRIFVMETAWIVRRWLSRETALPKLLKNVADTLGGVSIAFGLAYALFDRDEDFNAALDGFNPEPLFAKQYSDRITLFRDWGFITTQSELMNLELECRSLIEQNGLCLKM